VILVDSSVWIAYFRGQVTPETIKLEAFAAQQTILTGDLIVLEILQGARDERHAARIERALRRYHIVSLLNADLAVRAASNYRHLRGLGITVRKTPDIIIGTYCIEHGHTLLHDDRDFQPMQTHLGLQAA
jgi:predicted nucleic acid-binding protein